MTMVLHYQVARGLTVVLLVVITPNCKGESNRFQINTYFVGENIKGNSLQK